MNIMKQHVSQKKSNFNFKILLFKVTKDGYKLKEVVDKNMSKEGKILLARFMRLFERIIEYSKVNKMTSNSLAICLGMNLVHTSDAMESLQISPKVGKIFENIIDHSSIIFPLMNYKEAKFDDIYDPEFDEVSKISLYQMEDQEDDELIEYFNPLFDPEEFIEERDKSDWIRDSLFLDEPPSSLEAKLSSLRQKIVSYRQSNLSGINLNDLQKSILQSDLSGGIDEEEFEIRNSNKTREFSISSQTTSYEFEFDSPVVTPVEGNDVFTAEEILAHRHRSLSRRVKKQNSATNVKKIE